MYFFVQPPLPLNNMLMFLKSFEVPGPNELFMEESIRRFVLSLWLWLMLIWGPTTCSKHCTFFFVAKLHLLYSRVTGLDGPNVQLTTQIVHEDNIAWLQLSVSYGSFLRERENHVSSSSLDETNPTFPFLWKGKC